MILSFFLHIFLISTPFTGDSTTDIYPGTYSPCDSVPQLNKYIVDYVSAKLKKKVGRGECWDLAATALNTYRAKWDGRYGYGRSVDHKSECVYPGDIIQFERVVIESTKDGYPLREEMPHHTAVVYKVHSPGNFTIAHQNYNGKKSVILTPLVMSNIRKGKASIYRPQG